LNVGLVAMATVAMTNEFLLADLIAIEHPHTSKDFLQGAARQAKYLEY
jgi:hypothetical protein